MISAYEARVKTLAVKNPIIQHNFSMLHNNVFSEIEDSAKKGEFISVVSVKDFDEKSIDVVVKELTILGYIVSIMTESQVLDIRWEKEV